MQRGAILSIAQLFAALLILFSAGVASAQQIKVACVGDSITALPNGWCGYLGTKLGTSYTAQSFGVSGTTLLKNVGQPAFTSSNQYKPSQDFAPNIVVIMLGTNDSASRNWSAGKDHFVKDYEDLIDSYTSLASKPRVFLNTPPPASDDNMFTISGTTIENEINPLIKQVAMVKMCPLVDVWAAFGGDVEKIGSFDGVHPGDAGQMTIAETVYQAIKSPVVPGGSAGAGGSAGSGGGAGAGGAGPGAAAAGSGSNTSGVGGATANSSGAGGGRSNTGGANGGKAGSGNAGTSANSSASTSSPGAGSAANAGGNAGSSNVLGIAGSTPLATAARSGGGCQTSGGVAATSGPIPMLLVLLGLVMLRTKKRTAVPKTVAPLAVVALISISTGVAGAQTVKVACVGDSITALPSSWCGDLSTKLGSGYMVSNFGVSGTNLAKDVSQPYWDSAQYTPSHTFAPNIVIIMLGTNDAFTFSWDSAKSHFVADYKDLIDTYTSLASKPKPYIIIPTPIGTSPFGHDGNLLATEVIPMIKQVAMEKMVPTIDAFTLFGGTNFDPGLYGAMDQVHPNAKGQQMICDAVYDVLKSSGGPGGPGGSAGAGGSAGRGASAGSGATGTAGAAGMATAGSSANNGGVGSGPGGSSASSAGRGGANTGGSTSPGSGANTGGSASLAGAAGSVNAGGNSSIGVGGAGNVPLTTKPNSSDGGCRTAQNSASNSGPTAALVLLLGLAIRSRSKRLRS